MSFRPMFKFANGEVLGNAQRFATEAEARDSAADRFSRWAIPTDYSIEKSDDPVTYRRSNGKDVPVSRGPDARPGG